MRQRWFEPNLQKLLMEAGREGLRINHIVRNICNMEPQLFGEQHPYEEAWKEIYWFLRAESKKVDSPYGYVTGKRGHFFLDHTKMAEDSQMSIEF
ncbi:MAG: hypothetical protein IJP82_05690 [Bacteroidaceae bacterium]|nr:hypothetical protein [Bacteroidaceae bacterium]